MTTEPIEVVVVDDDRMVRQLLATGLQPPDFLVRLVASGPQGLAAVAERQPDVVVLDVRMPGMDGLETCRRLRQFSAVPVLLLTALTGAADAARGLEAGADDYVRKPFSVLEVAARLRALVRRAARLSLSAPGGTLRLDGGRLRIGLVRREVEVDAHRAALSPLEHRLLVCLATNWQRTVTHAELTAALWGAGAPPRPELLRVAVGNLRRKLGPGRHYLVGEYRAGYRLDAAPAAAASDALTQRLP